MRTEATPERVAKLPAWARAERTALQRRVSELEDTVAALRARRGVLDHNVFGIHTAVLDPYHHKVPVGDGHIEWTWPGGGRERRLIARFVIGRGTERDHVYLNASYGHLRIRPVASNALALEMYDD